VGEVICLNLSTGTYKFHQLTAAEGLPQNNNAVPKYRNLASQNQPVQNYRCIIICQQNPHKK
jgi:hypothetical protein